MTKIILAEQAPLAQQPRPIIRFHVAAMADNGSVTPYGFIETDLMGNGFRPEGKFDLPNGLVEPFMTKLEKMRSTLRAARFTKK